jgi:hypothetical protein
LSGVVAGLVLAGLCIRLALAVDAPTWAVGVVAIAFGCAAVVLGFWPQWRSWWQGRG